jgi:predicted  nucleic acid-binding Zn-ribbon protein
MVHTCAKCGKIYPDSSAEILIGCSQCGGKKFYFERPGAKKKKTPEAEQTPAHPEPQAAPSRSEEPEERECGSRVESIRIVAPGTYELNIEKMAYSDDRVVGLGREGSYAVDLLSMSGAKKKKKSDR